MPRYRVQWSKIKKRFKAFVCPELRRRIDFHVTAYREAHDDAGEGWITIDGKKAFDCGYIKCIFEGGSGMCVPVRWDYSSDHRSNVLRALEEEGNLATRDGASPRQRGIHSTDEFVTAMRLYPTIPVRDALHSSNPLLRAFAIIDRRVGRRSLEKLSSEQLKHPLVKRFHQLRLQVIMAKQANISPRDS